MGEYPLSLKGPTHRIRNLAGIERQQQAAIGVEPQRRPDQPTLGGLGKEHEGHIHGKACTASADLLQQRKAVALRQVVIAHQQIEPRHGTRDRVLEA